MAKAKRSPKNTRLKLEADHLVSIHGELYRSIITGFLEFCETHGQSCLLAFPSGRDLALRDLIFRLSPPDLLEKYKEPRVPDWQLEAQEKVRQINRYIHEINRQSKEIEKLTQDLEQTTAEIGRPVRRRLPDTRQAITHKFNVGGHEGYMTVGMFEDGSAGELFVTMAKEGSTIGGLMDTIGTLTSISLQYGVNIETLSKKFMHQRFEPSGHTLNPEIRTAASVIDYVFRWLEIHFVQSRSAVVESSPPEVLALPHPNV